jgi:hypothetical protein
MKHTTLLFMLAAALLSGCNLDTEPVYYSEVIISKNCGACTIHVTYQGVQIEIDTSYYSIRVQHQTTMQVETIISSYDDCITRWNNTIEWYDKAGYNQRLMNCEIELQIIEPV